MDSQTKREAEKNIRERKVRAEELAEANFRRALYFHGFKEANTLLNTEIISIAKFEAEGKELSLSRLNELKLKRADELKKLRMTEADINPNYSCKKCNDTGILNNSYCSCLKKEMSIILTKKSGFSELCSFADSNFELFKDSTKIKKLHNEMKKWCNTDSKKKVLILSGPTGVGKTFLIKAMANELIENGSLIRFATAFELGQSLLKYHTTFNEEKEGYLSQFLDTEVLFIDDLGTEPIYKNVTLEYLYLIINEFITKRKRLVITTNLDLLDLRDRYGERISSRLLSRENGLQIKIENSDLRLGLK